MIKKTFTVYILLCSDKSYYTGMTSNLDQRMQEHAGGKYPDSYTYSRRPVELVFSEVFDNSHDAILWESRIKNWSRKKKEALIQRNWDLISKLSKKDFKRRK